MKSKNINPQKAKGKKLALVLSGIMNNPNLPEKIFNSIQETFNDIFNNSPNQTEYDELENSPEYIAKILRELKSASEVQSDEK